jgi:predicted membrane protein
MKQTIIRVITGIIITAIGVSALLGALNIFPFWETFGSWWPTLVILGGIFVLIGDFRRNYIWGIVLLIIGVLLLLKTQGVLDFNLFSLIVPIIIIAGGLSVLLHTKNRSSIDTSSNNADDIAVIFSGSETKNKSKSYEGGKVTAIFGGAVLDLRDAKLSSQATLDIFALCGGIELRVPRDWKVVSKIAPIAGGVENKSEGSDDHKGPTLVLTGTVTFGGVEIKT